MQTRILYISPGTDLGGGEVSLLTLIANLDRTRFTPIVCAYGPGKFHDRAKQLNCELHLQSYAGMFTQPRFIWQINKLIRHSKADIVHVNTLDIRAGIATKLAGKILIGHLRVIFPTTFVDKTFVNLSDKTISVSNAVRDFMCQEQNTPPSHFQTIYNAVDTSHSEGPDLRTELGLKSDVAIVGVVGRIDPWKGMETFVDAVAELYSDLPNVHFVIAGSPGPAQEEQDYETHLHNKVKEANLTDRFHFLGYRSDALNLIGQLSILVVPSIVLKTPQGIKTEGFGRVAAEGLAMNTPVIASRAGGLPEIIEHGKTGLLFEPQNSVELSQNIRQILNDQAFAQKLSEEGKKRFNALFTVQSHLAQIQNLYDNLIAK